MGGLSSRDENSMLHRHAVERLDENVESWLPGYEDKQKARGFLATSAFVDLSIAYHGTYESFLTAILAAHGIDRELVEDVRLDYKISHESTHTIRISKQTYLNDIIKSDKTMLVFKVLVWKSELHTQELDFGDTHEVLQPERRKSVEDYSFRNGHQHPIKQSITPSGGSQYSSDADDLDNYLEPQNMSVGAKLLSESS